MRKNTINLVQHCFMNFLWLGVIASLFFPPLETSLTIEITNIKYPKGTLRLGVFRAENTFGSTYTKPDFGQMVTVNGSETLRTVIKLPPGQYAMALYHDINDNLKLDKNMVGIPKEPFGFSNNYRPVFSGPKFEDCIFEVKENGGSYLKIKLLSIF
ncbi:MAG: DUF2141 domain-containing protein [Spirosomataceae bacterium]